MLELLQPQKSMPQSEESERAVLAAVLLDPAPPAVGLRPPQTGGLPHRAPPAIYAVMLELQDTQVSIDLRTVQAKLEQKAALESAGGLAYLAGLDVDLPDLGRFEHYVEIVKERSVRRRLIDVCRDITRDCLDGGVDAQKALDRAESAVMALGEEAVRRGFVPFDRIIEETLEDARGAPGRRSHGRAVGVHRL